ncbi:hypothetical protein, partial [Klebsiella pneumoniae]|uniref:hypothetical protein n=1 Tax=Klebsiella pneumoniae TaxID=573 RepID=UPI004055874B
NQIPVVQKKFQFLKSGIIIELLNFRIEIKNLGGGKHQLIFKKLELTDCGEVTCKSNELSSSCKLQVKKGENKPVINFGDVVEAP